MARKRGLGKGLDALIPSASDLASPGAETLRVPVDQIQPNPRQPRVNFDEEGLQSLAASIGEHGVLQPLVVVPVMEGDGYQLIAGERRLLAAKMAGLKDVPVIVRQVDEQHQLELALVENLQRTDLNPLEAARGYHQLSEEFGLSHEEIATRVGKSRVAVSNTMRLLKLTPAVREALEAERISEGHARAMLSLSSEQAQEAALHIVLGRGLNVRQTEELIRQMGGARSPSRTTAAESQRPAGRSPEEVDMEDRLQHSLGTRVQLKRGRRGGRVIIHFFSDEELDAIVHRLLGEE